jgi:uncharacterized protein (TIGR03435 family)
MRPACVFAISLLACVAAFGQTFEVASVRPTPPPEPNARVFYGPPRGGPGTADPGQISWTNATLLNIVMTAYDVPNYQVIAPQWLSAERYDILAKVPPGVTRQQVNVMWQNLLQERFGMVVHHESKEFSVQALTVAKGGLKLKETTLPADAEPFTLDGGKQGGTKVDKNGLPELNGSGAVVMISMNPANPGVGAAKMVAKGLSLPEIAAKLTGVIRGPVVDKTGLAGKYDFLLEFTPDLTGVPLPPPPPGAPGPAPSTGAPAASDPVGSIPSAIEKQLGLKLSGSREKLDVIVVDNANKIPTEN